MYIHIHMYIYIYMYVYIYGVWGLGFGGWDFGARVRGVRGEVRGVAVGRERGVVEDCEGGGRIIRAPALHL